MARFGLCETASAFASITTGARPRPSKPWGCGSRQATTYATGTRSGGIGTAETKWDVEEGEAVALRGPEGDTGRAMSQENVEVLRRYNAPYQGDLPRD
jgi:hypothetical protein